MLRKVYSDDFKKGAVDQVIVQRDSISSIAKRLEVSYDSPDAFEAAKSR